MDKEQYYLKLIEEECAEIIQICSKASRFGIDNYPPSNPETTNRKRLKEEVNDLFGALMALEDNCSIDVSADEYMVLEKVNKIERYKQLSIQLGKLNE